MRLPWRRRDEPLTAAPALFAGDRLPPPVERAIRTGERLSLALFGSVLPPDEYLQRFYPGAPIPPLGQVVATATPLLGRVNGGNWIASCDCGGRGLPAPGGVVFVETPLVWCLRCLNGGTGRGWRPVVVPREGEREQIERILLCRPNVADQNWEPAESVADLLAQNVAHGDPVPEVRNGLRHPN
jgi:hypothetical protein